MNRLDVGDMILIILFVVSLGLLLWVFVGSTPTFEQIVLGFMLTIVFGVSIKVSSISTDLRLLRKSFSALARDFKEHIKFTRVEK